MKDMEVRIEGNDFATERAAAIKVRRFRQLITVPIADPL